MLVLVIRWLRYPCISPTAKLYRHFHRLFRRWKAWCFIWRFNWGGASVCEVSILARSLILFNNYKIFFNSYKTVPLVIQLQVAWMWNYVSSWKNQNVQEVFFYVSGVLDSERFFNKISALKNSLFSSRKLRKPDSGTSKKKGTMRKMMFCSSFVPKWSVN